MKAVQQYEDEIKAEKMASNLKGTGFWPEVRSVIGSNKTRVNLVDEFCGDEEIANLFHDKYAQLYNSVPYDEGDMMNIRQTLDLRIMDAASLGDADGEFTSTNVEQAVKMMSRQKSDGCTECLSDHFLNGTALLYRHIAILFNCMLRHASVPETMKLSTLIPIPKNRKKSLNDSQNYRAIALSSILGKVLDHTILLLHSSSLSTSDLQFGFKKKAWNGSMYIRHE